MGGWPNKPIRAILPIAPGTGADVVFRLVFNQVSIQLGQSIVIENRGGAGGTIGRRRSPRPNPTATRCSGNHVARHRASDLHEPALRRAARLRRRRGDRQHADRAGDRAARVSSGPGAGCCRQGQAGHIHLRVRRGGIDHASDRRALPAERRLRGNPRAVPRRRLPARDLRPAGSISRFRRSRSRCRTFATAGCWRSRSAARERASALPDVPTTFEVGYPNSDYVLWLGVFMPAKTPRAIVERLHRETVKALRIAGAARADGRRSISRRCR